MAQVFLGRKSEIRTLTNFFNEWTASENTLPRVALIWGQGGIGKSTLLSQGRRILKNRGTQTVVPLHIDWQQQRDIPNYALKTDRERVSPRDVFEVFTRELTSICKRECRQYKRQREAIDKALQKLEKHLAAQQQADRNSEDNYAAAKDIVGNVVGDVAAAAQPGAGAPAKQATKFGLQLVSSLFERFSPQLIDRTIKSLGKERQLIESSDSLLAAALGQDLRNLSAKALLLITFDTYEIIAGVDAIVREVIKAAGPRVGWIIVGRDDIYSGDGMVDEGAMLGYQSEDDDRFKVERIDLRALARRDVLEYFRIAAPSNAPPDSTALDVIYSATRGIPMAMELACRIWASGNGLDGIFDESGQTDASLVTSMVERYLKHCVDDNDRRALAAIAMAEGDKAILRAILEPDLKSISFDDRLRQLRKRHATVRASESGNVRLHDDAAQFFEQRLRQGWRDEPWVNEFAKRAADACIEEMDRCGQFHVLLEDRCNDDDYIVASVNAVHYLFWCNEDEAAQLLTLRYVDAMAHSRDLLKRLMEIAIDWRSYVSDRTRKRIGLLKDAQFSYTGGADAQLELLALLDEDKHRGWFPAAHENDAHADEREAIQCWIAINMMRRLERYDEAIDWIKRGVRKLPKRGAIRRKIAETASALSYALWAKHDHERELLAAKCQVQADDSWSRSHYNVGVAYGCLGEHRSALEHKLRALELDEIDAKNWREVGNSYSFLGNYDEALEHHLRALELDDADAKNWRAVGISYSFLSNHDEALKHHLGALKLDGSDAKKWREVGNSYSFLGNYDEALKHHLRALELDDTDAKNWRGVGNSYAWLRDHGEALTHYKRALELDDTDADNWRSVASSYAWLGDHEKALEHARTATERDPEDSSNWSVLAGVLKFLRRYADAQTAITEGLAIDADDVDLQSKCLLVDLFQSRGSTNTEVPERSPKLADDHIWWGAVALAYAARQRWNEVASTYQRMRNPDFAYAHTGLWAAKRIMNPDYEPPESLVANARANADKSDRPWPRALLTAISGAPEDALDALQTAIEETPCYADEARFRPEFVPLRDHPRFQELTKPID